MAEDTITPRPAKPLPAQSEVDPPKVGPHPIHRPDERKEGGPDFGKAGRQRERRQRDADDSPAHDTPRG